jgi:hypothetical protein
MKKLVTKFRALVDGEEKEARVYADAEEGYVHFKIGEDEFTFDWDSIERLGIKLKDW